MLCSCGCWTVEHEITRDKMRAGTYERCAECGRVEWTNLTCPECLETLPHPHEPDREEKGLGLEEIWDCLEIVCCAA